MSTLHVAGGRVLRPDMTIEDADVLVDQDAGEILAVGDVEGGDERLDASGGLVIPGLVNAHCHVSMTLLRGNADDKPLDAWLQEDIWPVEAELTPDDIRVGAELGLVEMIRGGVTSFADMYFEVPDVVDAIDRAGMRALVGYGSITIGRDEDEAREDMARGIEVARELDGAADGRVTTAYMPHSLTTVGEQYLEEFVPQAREAGLRLHYHANETVDEVDPIVEEHGHRPMEYADDLDMLGSDDFFAHGVHLDESEIDLLAERGTSVVHCPASNMKLASGMAPVQDLLDAGVTVGLGTDGAASNNDLDMFGEMRDAAMLGKLAANDASAVAAESVVEMATAGGADVLGIDSGRIEAGANADLAVVDLEAAHLTPHHDLVSHLTYAVKGSDVRHTVCDGTVLMRDRDVLTLDEDAVRERAESHAADLIARAEN
ncbi:amidohydrolase [Haloarculaceae archaeon H-GB2-1]|nr:amidohydrolase [Haloarculaceae archaeon H-GB1-1]MEA5388822.1 amidohydrolase [Haloarculaceae archaeon H-GB11]MEA5406879.1 amidohydrolase [Haloarculaceae archaeon H-GB2-1]